jgi:hypothetical protein
MKINRQEVYDKCGGCCGYCGQAITIKQMQVDHVFPRSCGGTSHIDNLLPACRQCNHYKRAQTIGVFRETMYTLHERILKIYIHKVAVNFGMALLVPWDGKFYYEKINVKVNEVPFTSTEMIREAIKKVKTEQK